MSTSTPKAPDPQPDDDRLDEALEETFPASDPIAVDPPASKPDPAHDDRKNRGAPHHGKH